MKKFFKLKKKINVGIIVALENEIKNLKNAIKNYKKYKVCNITFYIGKIHNIRVVLVKSGIGKVCSGMICTILLQKYQIDLVINTGSAGSLNLKLNPGCIILPNGTCYHDFNITAFGYKLGHVKNYPKIFPSNFFLLKLTEKFLINNNITYKKDLILSGDSFICKKNHVKFLKKKFPKAIAVDMESTAIAHVCYQFHIPILIIKSISDYSNEHSTDVFKNFINKASQLSSMVTINTLHILSKEINKNLIN